MKEKISVIMPIYKPDEKVLEKVKEMLKKQTIKPFEIIENWDMPEIISINTGIKKAKGDFIVILEQDCVPENEFWLERLIAPLKDKSIVATVSDLDLSEEYWSKYPFLTKILTINELKETRSLMDIRACGYRKETLKKINYINEDPKLISVDVDHRLSLEKLGKIVHPGCKVYHLHPLTNRKKIRLVYNYARGGGIIARLYKFKDKGFWYRIARATPILGMFPIIYVFPWEKFGKYWPWLFPHLLLAPLQHIIYIAGFLKGFLWDWKN